MLSDCFSTVAATEENQGFLHTFPFLSIAYTSCAVIFGHVLAGWNANSLGGAETRHVPATGPVVRCRDAVVGPELRELSLALKRALPGVREGVSILP